jgi:3-phosphoglycerate kinase
LDKLYNQLSIQTFSELKKYKSRRVLLRLDLNESLDKRGKLLDDYRLQSVIPTIQQLQKNHNKIVIVSHMGRPDGKISKSLSLEPIAKRLAEILNVKFVVADKELPTYPVAHLVLFTGDITDSKVNQMIAEDKSNNIILLENIRFYPEEEQNDSSFAKLLSGLGDFFVNDCFAVDHRKAASISAITKFLPSLAGPLLSKEILALDHLVSGKIKQPFVLLMGGVKISDKAQTLKNLGKHADQILIGGGLANLFLAVQGYNVDAKKFDKADLVLTKQILTNFKNKIVLPKDVVVESKEKVRSTKILHKVVSDLKISDLVYDIGPKTILEYSKILREAKTICWNGPLGFFEQPAFKTGTMAIAKVIGAVGKRKAYTVVGGGETVAAVRQSGQEEYFDHVSTGGGAMLEYLAGNKLPGIEALK